MQVEVNTDAAVDRLERELDYATKSEQHLWAVITSYKVSEAALDALGEGPLLLDQENIMMTPQVGCLVCEQPYSTVLRRRRCKGDPSRG